MNKKHVLASVIGALLIGVAGASVAKDATITFKGSIDATTCTVTGGTGTTATVDDFTVDLPKVSVGRLAANGDVAGEIPFTVELAGTACTDGKIAKMNFEASRSPNINTATGNLKNKAGATFAKNVEVQLLNKAGNAINLGTNANVLPETIAANKATFTHTAQYRATGVATAGAVETSVVYSIAYN
ncbi:MAG TPA: fimbrial protein [Luteibacter sp.]|jgi:major type 1 subunit fimbrin (pilin)|nr:fimbrial protein [Luteibacter sp.]